MSVCVLCMCISSKQNAIFTLLTLRSMSEWNAGAGYANWMYQWVSEWVFVCQLYPHPPTTLTKCVKHFTLYLLLACRAYEHFFIDFDGEKNTCPGKNSNITVLCHWKYTTFQVAQFSPSKTEIHSINISQTVKWQEKSVTSNQHKISTLATAMDGLLENKYTYSLLLFHSLTTCIDIYRHNSCEIQARMQKRTDTLKSIPITMAYIHSQKGVNVSTPPNWNTEHSI